MQDSDALAISRVRARAIGDAPSGSSWSGTPSAVFRVAFRVTGRVEDAEDVVQETFLRAYRQAEPLRGALQRPDVAAPHCHELRHRSAARRPKREVAGGAGDPGTRRGRVRRRAAIARAIAAGVQIGERLAGAMALLTEMERATFTLRHFEGLSIDAIGGKLGLKTAATKHSIFRAVRKMRRELRPFIEV